jgi:hypothetical protein
MGIGRTAAQEDRDDMIDRDIWITANDMIKLHGDEAAMQAAIRAEEGYADWNRIVRAINELRDMEPGGSLN